MISSEGKNLVFILSLPRSGSTLLSLLLGSHPVIYCPPEPWFLLKLATLTQPCTANIVFDDEMAAIGTSEFLSDQTLTESIRAFATTAYNSHLQKAGKAIFVDKTPRYYHILSFLDQLFPKARKIWLKRNPLDVASSYKQIWNIDLDVFLGQKITPVSFDFAVGLFELATYFEVPTPDKFEIQYEKLVKDPHQVLTGLCAWLGVPFETKMLEYQQNQVLIAKHNSSTMGDKKALVTNEIHSQSIGNWNNSFTLTELQQLVGLLGFDIFHKIGYSEVVKYLQVLGLSPPPETEAAEIRDRIAKGNVNKIQDLRREVETLKSKWQTSEADRSARLELIHRLRAQVEASEAERVACLELSRQIQESSEAERVNQLELINQLSEQLKVTEAALVEAQTNFLIRMGRKVKQFGTGHAKAKTNFKV